MTTTELAERYIAVWNEPDPDARRRAIASLWTEDAMQVLQPPAEMLATAETLGVTASLHVQGHAQLERRVTRAYEDFVAPGETVFRARGGAHRLDDVVRVVWEMVPTGGGEPLGAGLEVLVVDEDGRIRLDYQFIEP